jgi:hypothetical protein
LKYEFNEKHKTLVDYLEALLWNLRGGPEENHKISVLRDEGTVFSEAVCEDMNCSEGPQVCLQWRALFLLLLTFRPHYQGTKRMT